MPEVTIPDEHHVARHCPRNRTIRKEGVVVGVIPRLFELRLHKNEKYLSASYLEYFDGTERARVKACVDATPREICDKDCMVVMNVGTTRSLAKKNDHTVRIVHKTDHKSNPAYAMIKGVPFDPSSTILALLAGEAKDKIFLVGDLRKLDEEKPHQ